MALQTKEANKAAAEAGIENKEYPENTPPKVVKPVETPEQKEERLEKERLALEQTQQEQNELFGTANLPSTRELGPNVNAVAENPEIAKMNRVDNVHGKGTKNESANDKGWRETLALSRLADAMNNRVYARPGHYAVGLNGLIGSGTDASTYERPKIETEEMRQQAQNAGISEQQRKDILARAEDMKNQTNARIGKLWDGELEKLHFPMMQLNEIKKEWAGNEQWGIVLAQQFGADAPVALQMVTPAIIRKELLASNNDPYLAAVSIARKVANAAGMAVDTVLQTLLPIIFKMIGTIVDETCKQLDQAFTGKPWYDYISGKR
jgi:hypothetical protein